MLKGYPKLISLTGGVLVSCIQIGCSQLPSHMNPNRPSSSRATSSSNMGTQSSNMAQTSSRPAKLEKYTPEHINQLSQLIGGPLKGVKEFVEQFKESVIPEFISTPSLKAYRT